MHFYADERGSFTVETAIVTGFLILAFAAAFCLSLQIYGQTLSYSETMRTAAEVDSEEGLGNILRIVKVVVDKGGEIIDKIFRE